MSSVTGSSFGKLSTDKTTKDDGDNTDLEKKDAGLPEQILVNQRKIFFESKQGIKEKPSLPQDVGKTSNLKAEVDWENLMNEVNPKSTKSGGEVPVSQTLGSASSHDAGVVPVPEDEVPVPRQSMEHRGESTLTENTGDTHAALGNEEGLSKTPEACQPSSETSGSSLTSGDRDEDKVGSNEFENSSWDDSFVIVTSSDCKSVDGVAGEVEEAPGSSKEIKADSEWNDTAPLEATIPSASGSLPSSSSGNGANVGDLDGANIIRQLTTGKSDLQANARQVAPPTPPKPSAASVKNKENSVNLEILHNSVPPPAHLPQPATLGQPKSSGYPPPRNTIRATNQSDVAPPSNQAQGYSQLAQPRQQKKPSPPPPWKPIISPITATLSKLIADNPKENEMLFYAGSETAIKPLSWKWDDPSFVQLPFCSEYKKWKLIVHELAQLKRFCDPSNYVEGPSKLGNLMRKAVFSYNEFAKTEPISDFKILSLNPEFSKHIISTIPIIVELALQLPFLVSTPIPILAPGANKTLFLTKRLCASLLANAFLCTLPEVRDGMPNINFLRLFDRGNDAKKAATKVEKIMCILNYFHQIYNFIHSENANIHPTRTEDCIVSFERRCLTTNPQWGRCTKSLVDVKVDPTGKIEDKNNMLQVDFANKIVGGGVIGNGAVMEEIRFSICPELIVARLFTAPLEDNEAIFIKGSQQFSNHFGYAASFKFDRPVDQTKLTRDNLNRMEVEVVCMDALHFKPMDVSDQFKRELIDRELLKCAVAFQSETCTAPVATGNWGCGAFNGDPELKFLIQWIAASEAGRDSVHYHTAGGIEQEEDILKIVGNLQSAGLDVKQLYNIVVDFYGEHFHCDSIFDYILHRISQRKSSRRDK